MGGIDGLAGRVAAEASAGPFHPALGGVVAMLAEAGMVRFQPEQTPVAAVRLNVIDDRGGYTLAALQVELAPRVLSEERQTVGTPPSIVSPFRCVRSSCRHSLLNAKRPRPADDPCGWGPSALYPVCQATRYVSGCG